MELLMNSHYIICYVAVDIFLVRLGHHLLGTSGSLVFRNFLLPTFFSDDGCVFVFS